MTLPGEPGYGMPSRGAAIDLKRQLDGLQGQVNQLQTQLATVAASANTAAAAATAAELSYSFISQQQLALTYATGWTQYAVSGSPFVVPAGFNVMTWMIIGNATAVFDIAAGGVIDAQIGTGTTSSTTRRGSVVEGVTHDGNSTVAMPIYSGTQAVTPGDSYYFSIWAQTFTTGSAGGGACYVNGLIIWSKS